MSADSFNFFKKFLYDKAGLSLTEEKSYLLETRLSPVLRKRNFSALEQLIGALKFAGDNALIQDVIDAMTTNETLFFRDDRPFKYFREKILPGLFEARTAGKTLRVWSAACSTGQEPYSIAMSLSEMTQISQDWRIDILATDVSEAVVTRAASGEFNQFEVQRGLPIQLLVKYFRQDGAGWKIKDSLRNMIRFEMFNLMNGMDKFGTFDIIFCRNVLIYFDDETKKKVLRNLARRLAPDGFLFLGGSETVIGLCPALKACVDCPGLYAVQKTVPAGNPVSGCAAWTTVTGGSAYAAKNSIR